MPDEPADSTAKRELGLEGFQQAPQDEGLSLDELSEAFAQVLSDGSDPYEAASPPDDTAGTPVVPGPGQETESVDGPPTNDGCAVSPKSILEAMLFVGHPDGQPLTAAQVSALMRGVRPQEIDEFVKELNEAYASEGCPYFISSAGAGYQFVLRDEFHGLRDKFFGRIRQARLSQAAIDVLSLVAYNQPLGRDEIDKLRGRPSGGVLSLLVRRQLLRLERSEDKPRKVKYYTTDRFLDVFGLRTLEDLPRSQELDRA